MEPAATGRTTRPASRLRPLPRLAPRGRPSMGADAFAARVAGRHGRADAGTPPLDRVQRDLPALRWSRSLHQHWQLTVAPQLRLQFAGRVLAVPPVPVSTAPGLVAFAPPAQPVPGPVHERLLERSHRIDSLRLQDRLTTVVSAAPPGPALAPLPALPARPPLRVERVLREREVVVPPYPAQASSPIGASAATTPGQTGHEPPATPTPPRMPDLDVSALADRVVQTIDRRLLAHRERLGRI